MKPRSFLPIASLPAALAICLTLNPLARGATLQWDGGSVDIVANGDGASAGGAGTWNTTTLNWDQGVAAHIAWPGTGNNAVFGGTGGTVTLGTAISADNISIAGSSAYTIATGTGMALTIKAGVSVSTTSLNVISGLGGLALSGGTGGSQTFNGSAANSTVNITTTLSGSDNISLTGGRLGLTNASNSGYTGKISVSGNTSKLYFNSDATLGAVPGAPVADSITLSNGGFLIPTATLTSAAGAFNTPGDSNISVNRGITLGTGGGNIQVGYGNGGILTVNSVITGGGSLTKTDSGRLILKPGNTFTGGFTISGGGRLGISADSALGGTSGTFTVDGSTVVNASAFFTGNDNYNNGGIINLSASRGVVLVGTATFHVGYNNAGSIIINGPVSGAGLLRKTDNASVVLMAANSYSGGTTVDAGTVAVGEITTGVSTNPGTSTSLGSGAVSVTSGAQLLLAGKNLNIANNITLNGTATQDGRVGALVGGLQSGASANTVSGMLTLAGTGDRTVSTWWSDKTLTLSGKVTGTGTLRVVNINAANTNEAGVVILGNNTNDYSGGTVVSAVATLRLNANDVVPDGAGKSNVAIDGRLEVNGFTDTVNGLSGAGVISLGTGILIAGNTDATSTFSGSIGGTPTGSLRKIGTGTLTVSGANDNNSLRARLDAGTMILAKTSSGGVHAVGSQGNTDYALTINGGTAQFGGTGEDQIYQNSAVNMTGGTLDLTGVSEGFDGLTGSAGTVTNSVTLTTSTLTLGQNNSLGSQVFNGVIQNGAGTTAVTKTGTGTQTLTGANTYTGATTINAGSLQLGSGGSTGSLSTSSAITVTGTGKLVIVRGDDVSQGTLFSNSISGTGGLTQAGLGTLTLNASNAYTGTTTVNSGVLAGTGSVAGPLNVGISGTLAPGANAIGIFTAGASTIAGTYACEVSGGTSDMLVANGTLDVSAASLIINEVTPLAGTVIIASYTGSTPAAFSSVSGLPGGYRIEYHYHGNQIAITTETPFQNWAYVNITASQPTADATFDGDPDSDGETNLAEFGLNGNPLSGTASGKVVSKIAMVDGVPSLVLSFPVRSTSPAFPAFGGTPEKVSAETDGITYRVQGSTTLVSWNEVVEEVFDDDKATIETGLPGLDNGWFYRTFTTGPVSALSADFMRVGVD